MSRERSASTARDPGDLEALLSRERFRVEEGLKRAMAALEPHLSEKLVPVVRYGVLSGGKRVRPVLCVAAFRAAGREAGPEIYDLAASLELIHAYSLMHDDLPSMDDAELRRGRPTAHRVYGVDATVRAGGALIPSAALQVWRSSGRLGCPDEIRRALVRTLCDAAGAAGMVGGQMLDLWAEGRELTAGELDDLHRRKTGTLLAAAPRMGGMAAGAPDDALEAFHEYGRAVGLAFQIADDILDATATARELGKKPSDRELAKSTYVANHGLEGARSRAEVVRLEALGALKDAGIDAPLLVALADFVVRRRK